VLGGFDVLAVNVGILDKAEKEKAKIPARIGRQYDHRPGAAADG
jgi:hypothetical protein